MMQPGRKLDVLVAEKLMGIQKPAWISCGRGTVVWEEELPRYSTDIAAAWTVLDKLEDRWRFTLRRETDFGGGGQPITQYYTAIFDPAFTDQRDTLLARGSSAPHVICLAALRAIE